MHLSLSLSLPSFTFIKTHRFGQPPFSSLFHSLSPSLSLSLSLSRQEFNVWLLTSRTRLLKSPRKHNPPFQPPWTFVRGAHWILHFSLLFTHTWGRSLRKIVLNLQLQHLLAAFSLAATKSSLSCTLACRLATILTDTEWPSLQKVNDSTLFTSSLPTGASLGWVSSPSLYCQPSSPAS